MGQLYKKSAMIHNLLHMGSKYYLPAQFLSFSKSELNKPQNLNGEYCLFSFFYRGILFTFANWVSLTDITVI